MSNITEQNTLKNYPIQFKDKLDEYLWKEHHIIGGCCSSIESLKYTVAREVAEKLTDTFLEKAGKFLERQKRLSNIFFDEDFICFFREQMMED